MKRVEDGPPVRLTDHPSNEHSLSWSADGRSLAFLRDNEGVFILRPDDAAQAALVSPQQPGAVYGVGSSWSRDGRVLFYSEFSKAGAPLQIFRLEVATGSIERITNPSEGHGDMNPSLSPDGPWIASVRRASSLAAGAYVLPIDADGRPRGEPQRVTTDSSRIAGLDWLPESAGIVFSSDHAGTRRLWTVQRNRWGWSKYPQPMALAGEDAFQPRVAQSVPALVYSRRFWPVAIWRLDLDPKSAGAPLVKLAASAREDMEPSWSPGGDRIAFVSTRSGHTEIWVCRADGTGGIQLTRFGGPLTHSPAWSPDASTIAFHSGTERASSVFVMSASGGAPRQVTPAGMHSVEPTWSHDGEQVYFSSTEGGISRIWRIPARGGTPVPVTTELATQPQLSSDGEWLYFRRKGIWRVLLAGGAEQQVVPGPVGTYALGQDRILLRPRI
jgi:Tol biopolymer transport system component